MAILKQMKPTDTFDLTLKFLEVKEDILIHSKELVNRCEYFTKKYRGNRLSDLNVGIYQNDEYRFVTQIFIRNKQGYIRNRITFTNKGRMLSDDLKIRLNG